MSDTVNITWLVAGQAVSTDVVFATLILLCHFDSECCTDMDINTGRQK